MWWWLKKIEENDESVVYVYGVATQDATGKILLTKENNEVTRIKMADNDNETLFAKFAGYVRHYVAKAGYPEVRSIATG